MDYLPHQLPLTAASLARKIFHAKNPRLGQSVFLWKEDDQKYRDLGLFFGGRCEVFRIMPKDDVVQMFDVNSMYPFLMASMEYPVPPYIIFKIFEPTEPQNIFLRKCRLDDRRDIPFAPEKVDDHVLFRSGIKTAYLFNFEYNRLSEEGRILEVLEEWQCNGFVRPFQYLRNLLNYRYGRLAKTVKLLANSTFGKFGSRWTRNIVQYSPLSEIESLDGWYHNHQQTVWWQIKTVCVKRQNVNIIWAAQTTAAGRFFLWTHLIEAAKLGNIYYCDTDSIACSLNCRPVFDFGPEPGRWKEEWTGPRKTEPRFILQKLYQTPYGLVKRAGVAPYVGPLTVSRKVNRRPSLKKIAQTGSLAPIRLNFGVKSFRTSRFVLDDGSTRPWTTMDEDLGHEQPDLRRFFDQPE